MLCLPQKLFEYPTSTVVYDKNGELLGARIAEDGQWRYPELEQIPERIERCVLLFEDEYFYRHPGVNPFSIWNALRHNFTHKNRRGGSTITQQMIRLSRQNPPRTYLEKLKEAFMATRAEWRFSKQEILKKYLSHAPFGGNVMGLEAASWRYFGIPASRLSWGQSALLAVLPNAPSLIFPGRNQQLLKVKRDRLLEKLFQKGHIDSLTFQLAIEEPLPGKPLPLPNLSHHLTELIVKEKKGEKVITTLEMPLQIALSEMALNYHRVYTQNQIDHLAILVLDIEKQQVLGYVGNVPSEQLEAYHVDLIQAKRSTGSLLKPFLYANILDEGLILPNSLVPDIPVVINGYKPKNFDKSHSGMVPADQALARSLNVPAVTLLRDLGLPKFHKNLNKLGLNKIDKPPDHYGLSLILGGAESNLWEMTNAYAGMARTVNEFTKNSSSYASNSWSQFNYLMQKEKPSVFQLEPSVFGAGALYQTLEALREVNRPRGEENWTFFSDAQPMAWKTGTSFGFKDAWAIGVTPKYAIGVWVGNADGEGRPGLTGLTAAAPVLFEVLDRLPSSGWFAPPYDDLKKRIICKESGNFASPYCEEIKEEWVTLNGYKVAQCLFHKPFFLDETGQYQVNANCYPREKMQQRNLFVLSPTEAYYYQQHNADYIPTPPFHPGCHEVSLKLMEFIFPKKGEAILLPKNWGGQKEEVSMVVAHQRQDMELFWYMDTYFIGSTQGIHEMSYPLTAGVYNLTVVDEEGNRISQELEIKTP